MTIEYLTQTLNVDITGHQYGTVSYSGDGLVSATDDNASSVTAYEGEDITLTFTPLTGSQITVTVDGTPVEVSGNSYTLTNIGQNGHTIAVTFSEPLTVWTGSTSADWTDPGNWNIGVPAPTSQVVIPASATVFPTIPDNTTVKSITFEQDAGADLAGTFHVTESLSVDYTIAGGQWYAIGFPFPVSRVYSHYFENNNWTTDLYPYGSGTTNDYYLRKYENGFTPVSTFGTDAYIAYFPTWHNNQKLSFISGPLDLDVAAFSTLPASSEYQLVKNPTFNKILLSATADIYYYVLNSARTSFNLVENDRYLNAFESVITILKSSVSSAPAHIEITDTPTGISLHEASEPVIATHYYSLQGVEIAVEENDNSPVQSGVLIKKTVYQSGAVSVSKIIRK
jgi:hypothetical protein